MADGEKVIAADGTPALDLARAEISDGGENPLEGVNFAVRDSSAETIAVVGGGVAGLTFAAQGTDIQLAPINVYEGGDRLGGRMYTEQKPDGSRVERGGTFIDGDHAHIIALCEAYGVPLVDRYKGTDPLDVIFADMGRAYSAEEFLKVLDPVVKKLQRDAEIIAREEETGDSRHAVKLDAIPVEKYLAGCDVPEWAIRVFMTGFEGEYAGSARRVPGQPRDRVLSAYALIDQGLHEMDPTNKKSPFGSDYQRYRIEGGSSALIDRLAEVTQTNGAPIETGHRLVAVDSTAQGNILTFDVGGHLVERRVDKVAIGVPLGALKSIDFRGDYIDPEIVEAIQNLRFGSVRKIALEFQDPPWRREGTRSSGNVYNEFGEFWEDSYDPKTGKAWLTLYNGGPHAEALTQGLVGSRESTVASLVDSIERVYPGAKASFTGQIDEGVNWAGNSLFQGGFREPALGELYGGDFEPLRRAMGAGKSIRFIGEHTEDNYGYMDSAVKSGLRVLRWYAMSMGRDISGIIAPYRR